MKKPLIGIVGRIQKDEIVVYDDYCKSILKSGGIPFLLLPTNRLNVTKVSPFINDLTEQEKEDLLQTINLCDGFLFPGGSKWYGFDEFIFEHAYQNNIPVLGICLGMQLMANYNHFNEISSDKTVLISSDIEHQSKMEYVHEVFLKDSKLKDILNVEHFLVNSRHFYQIRENDLYVVSSQSIDGVIESIEFPNKDFILGVQWHPESVFDFDVNSKKLFLDFLNSCKKNS